MQVITQYANEQLWEQEWQKEYKYGVILFIPPEPILSTVNELREKYDKFSANGCCAHISLTMPLKKPLTIAGINEIKRKLLDFKKFEVHYGPFINFLPVAEDTLVLTEKLNKNAMSGSFTCDKVVYIVPDQDMVFQKIIAFNLA